VLSMGTDRVNVPSVVGSTISTATQRLRGEGFDVVYVRDNSDKPKNTVVGQDPAGGTSADKGSKVTLNISEGQPIVKVPDVVGKGRREARRTLTDAGFQVQERRLPSDSVQADRVIAQSPSGNSRAERGDSVRIDVSTGAEKVPVPGVVGKSEDDASAAIEAAGLRVSVAKREDDEQDAGTVLEQSPGRGAGVARGSTVTITVAEASKQVTVPDVVGRSQNFATSLLSGRGLKVNVENQPADSPDGDGLVQAQTPGADEKVDRGTEVTITVGTFDPDLNPDPGTTTTTPTTTTTVPR
jgi:beta-lactam-binding protein with PASTA domain